MSRLWPTLSQVAILVTGFKVLLFPAYKSTDFEVHRNWLAITNSLPVRQWYFEETSEWTLDYPPFFAYFEWAWSQFAQLFDDRILQISQHGYDSWQTVYFQRSTVIIMDLVLLYALHRYVDTTAPKSQPASHAIAVSIILSPALLIIDHIHFQYNGFLFGLLIWSIVNLKRQETMLSGAVLFAVLLCFKHIFLYLAPAFFVYLLRAFCLRPQSIFQIRFQNCLKLAISLAVVFGAAFGPFWDWRQIDQVLRRLFPFSRGLCHAYWAPNIWSMYSFTDRVLLLVSPRLGFQVNESAAKSVTRGLIGDSNFAVLPDIAPNVTFILTIAFQLPALVKLFVTPRWENFIGAVTLCAYASFLFGWHVHEKAILLVMIPFSLVALRDRRFLGAFRPLAVAGHVSLFPLLFTAHEFPVKIVYTLAWLICFLLAFDRLAPVSSKPRVFLLDRFALFYIVVSIPLIIYCSLLHPLLFGARYEFIPLMFISSYSAIGVVGSWLGFAVVYFSSEAEVHHKTQ